MDEFDVVIIGSGPSGAQAAAESTAAGLNTCVVDVGFSDRAVADAIPPGTFLDLRRGDPRQGDYLLGDSEELLRDLARAGAHLTPPRKYMIRQSEQLLPLRSGTFLPIQSTSTGGLGVSWGSNVFTLEDWELQRVGIPADQIHPFYERVAGDIGVSGDRTDDISPLIAGFRALQPPLKLDTNSRSILANYRRIREKTARNGFHLGQSVVAVLSEPKGDRLANPYHDMDFYHDSSRSVYRPQFTIEALKKCAHFTHLPGRVAVSFKESDGTVTVRCRLVGADGFDHVKGRRLLLAAGAINSGRLALNSFPDAGARLNILCNPNSWVGAVNLSMLGRPADDPRYSLAQLTLLQRREDPERDYTMAQFYSYRSLMYFRVLRGIPLPPKLGLLLMRLIATSFTCVNIHHSDAPALSKWMKLVTPGDWPETSVHYVVPEAQQRAIRRAERTLLVRLLSLRCLPLNVMRPPPGASIHYAGTLPVSDSDEPFTCDTNGRLHGTQGVYVADGSSWKWLPAKGLTFTLMANARRIARQVAQSLNP